MKYEYDPEVDVMLIKLRSGKPDYAEEMENFIMHYDKDHKLIQIEILFASKTIGKATRPMLTRA